MSVPLVGSVSMRNCSTVSPVSTSCASSEIVATPSSSMAVEPAVGTGGSFTAVTSTAIISRVVLVSPLSASSVVTSTNISKSRS